MCTSAVQYLLEIYTTLSAGVFAGAVIYISLVEHPARMDCETGLAVKEFRASYRRAAPVQGMMLMTSAAGATALWALGAGGWWAAGAAVLLALIPFTLAAIFPVSKKLLDASAGEDPERERGLLTRWGRLHMLRSLCGLISFLIFLILLWRGDAR